MDNESAQIILSVYRPDGVDANDPLISEALEQARLDPELGRWFAKQQTFDSKMAHAVKSLQPPEHLKAAILVASQAAQKNRETEVRALRRRWAKPAWMALAASVVLLLGGVVLFHATEPKPIPFASVTNRILQLRDQLPLALGAINTDPKELQRWLAAHRGPHDFDLPSGLAAKSSVGCQVFNIQGNKVSLICFQLDDQRVVHYFVMERSELINPPPVGQPVTIEENGTSFVAWSDKHRSYVLAEFATGSDLKTLL